MAYNEIGEDWKQRHEKGHEKTVAAQKELIAKDDKKTTKVLSVYRLKAEDGIGEFITWDQITEGHTGIGNLISYYEGHDDLCVWYEPVPEKEIRFNVEKQEQEVVTKPDISQVKKHYLYPFNKSNVDMIKKITANNRRCQFYVKDTMGITRVVKNFDEWSSKDFDTLIAFHPTQPLDAHSLQQHLQYH